MLLQIDGLYRAVCRKTRWDTTLIMSIPVSIITYSYTSIGHLPIIIYSREKQNEAQRKSDTKRRRVISERRRKRKMLRVLSDSQISLKVLSPERECLSADELFSISTQNLTDILDGLDDTF